MNGSVSEWLAKADGDFEVAQLVLGTGHRPNYDAVCFHCQQCIEKTLKAVLIHKGTNPPRIHDLVVLSDQVKGLESRWNPADKELRFLSQGANLFRYPGETANKEKAEVSLTICTRIRKMLLILIDPTHA